MEPRLAFYKNLPCDTHRRETCSPPCSRAFCFVLCLFLFFYQFLRQPRQFSTIPGHWTKALGEAGPTACFSSSTYFWEKCSPSSRPTTVENGGNAGCQPCFSGNPLSPVHLDVGKQWQPLCFKGKWSRSAHYLLDLSMLRRTQL